MNSVLLFVVGTALSAGAPVTETRPSLFVSGSGRFEPVPTRGGDVPVVIPLLSRSELVVRAVRTQRGIGLRCDAGVELAVTWVEHADDERIALDLDGELRRLTGMQLPSSITIAHDEREWAPWIARQDGSGLTAFMPYEIAVDPSNKRDGEQIVWFGVAGDSNSYRTLTPSAGTDQDGLTIGPQSVEIDQVLLARIAAPAQEQRLDASATVAMADGLIERWYPSPPDHKPGFTHTLIVRGQLAVWQPTPPVRGANGALFRDVSRDVGVDMVHCEGPDLQIDIRPTMGPGAAWGDIDGDGWVDLFLPQGGGRSGTRVAESRMYRNRGDGTFEDVSSRSGLALRGAGMGALFFDADGDGDLDLFVANYGTNRLLANDGSGGFSDITDNVGLTGDRWHAGVCAADTDRDGDLDVYVTSYLHYDETEMPTMDEIGRYRREDPIAMLPFAFPGEINSFWRNDRDVVREASTKPALGFHFTDVAKALGLADEAGRGMQSLFWDFDRDGDQDLYVANDVSPNRFWRNEGNGKWKDIGFSTGVDDPRGSMGLSAGDVDGDGDEDLFVTNWQLEANALYVNNLVNKTSAKSHVATFRDNAVQSGLGPLSVGVTKWGAELADFDLDGDLDLAYANGYTSPDYESTGICVGQPCHYFENDGEGRFSAAFERAGPAFAEALASRCLLACDYDQDGDLDLVITANNGRVRILRNEVHHMDRHWLGVRLRGQGGNTYAIGAEVEIVVASATRRRTMRAGGSYLGGNAPELHFGLGAAQQVESCRVRWPSGKESTHAVDVVDRFVTLTEP